jgi:hypothetical protein
MYSTLTVIRKFYLLKSILAYCGYSPTSPTFLLFSEHKHCDNAATNSNSENVRSRMAASLRRSVGTGTMKMSQVMGAFGLLDFTMLPPVLAWRAYWNLWTVSLIFQIFSGRDKPRIQNPRIRGSACTLVHKYSLYLNSSSLCNAPTWRWPHNWSKHVEDIPCL